MRQVLTILEKGTRLHYSPPHAGDRDADPVKAWLEYGSTREIACSHLAHALWELSDQSRFERSVQLIEGFVKEAARYPSRGATETLVRPAFT